LNAESLSHFTGSACTKRQLHLTELLGGTTATRRRIETGQEMNRMSGLHASVTRRMGSRTGRAATSITTLARNAQVGLYRPSTFVHANSCHGVF